jgi:hypothetical protein
MARVKRTERSRKEHICGRGGHVIPKGDPYLSASPGYHGSTIYRCVNHPFRPSELTRSARSAPLSALEAWQDAVSAGIESHDDLESEWDALGDALTEFLEEREQALEAWENGNGQLEELMDTAQAAVDEWDSHSLEAFDEEEPEDTDSEEWQEWDERRREHLEEQVNEADSIAGGIEV